ncbi:MAG TPA: Gfo/Idh/MocA family oxidoreductase [Methylomirabilota bacterium]
MTIRVAGIEVSHWHAVHDAAYLRHFAAMPDVALVGVQDGDASLARKRAAEVGDPPVFTDYHRMLKETRPDFVIALGRHRQMAKIAHDLLDAGYPFMMEKPMGVNAQEVQSIADKAARLNAFVSVPLSQRYQPFAIRARDLIASGRLGPLSHIYIRVNRPGPARYPGWDSAWMLDPAEAGGGCLRNLGPHGFDMFLHLTGEDAQVTGAQISRRAHAQRIEDYASALLRSASGILGTIEVGNTFPRVGTDGEWKVAGRDGILTLKDGVLKLAGAGGDEVEKGTEIETPYATAIRDALEAWQRGAAPPISVRDCLRAVRLIDQAYALAR